MKSKIFNLTLRCSSLIIYILLLASANTVNAASRYSVATNARWDRTSTWSTTSGGASGASVPVAGDIVYIEGNRVINVSNAAAFCADVNIATGSTLNIAGQNFTSSGTTTVNGTIAFSNTTGTKTFGNVIIAGGTWTSSVGEAYGITNLTLSGSTISGSATGVFNVSGNLLVSSGTVNNLNAFTITVTGTSTIDGTASFLSATGTKTFTGLITVGSTGVWDNDNVNEAVTILGGITNNGTFYGGTAIYTFNTNNQTLNGTLAIANTTVNGITLTNNGNFTVATALSGNGGITNAATGTLNIGGTSAITTLTATAAGNIVNYTGAAQTVKATTYNNLTLSGTNTKTTTGVTVTGILSIEGTATPSVAPTWSGTAYGLQYKTTDAHTAGAEWINPFAGTAGITIANTAGSVTMNSVEVLNASIPLTIATGATLNTANYQLTLGGDFSNYGTFNAGSSPIVIAGTAATQGIDGFTTTGLVSMTKTAGIATLHGSVSGAGLTISGAGGTLNLGSGLSHTFTGAVTLSAGTLSASSSIVNATNNWTNNGGVFTPGTSTVNFTGNSFAINGTVTSQSFNNIIIAKTTGQTLSVGGNTTTLNVAGTFTETTGNFTAPTTMTVTGDILLTAGAYTSGATLNVSGNFTNNGATFTAGTGTVNLNDNIPQTIGGATSTAFNNLTILNSGIAGNNTVTIAKPCSVSGILTLTSGLLATTATNLLSVTNSATTAIIGGSSNSFINGPVSWTLPASLGSGSTYNFPVGKGTTYLPFSMVNPTTGTGLVSAQVEAFNSNSNGSIDGTLQSKSTTEYWSLTPTGNFTNSSVSLTRPTAITPLDAVSGTATLGGQFTNLDGTVGTYGVAGSNAIGINRIFALATKKVTITTGTISSSFCVGSAVSVPYTINGTFTAGNIFTAQLSNASGSFASPVNIGALTSTSAGTIVATIPIGTAIGSNYRIRVVSSNPSIVGSDNGVNLAVVALPSIPTTTGSAICIGSTATLSAAGGVAGDKYIWYDAASGGNVLKTSTDNTDNTYTTAILASTTNFWVSIMNASGCENSRTIVTATFPSVSSDDQNAAGSNSWIGHVYKGMNFDTYYGHYTETELFNESFGGATNCFSILSNSIARSIYTEAFSVRYRMNSTRKGLFVVDLGSDDGSRLTVDGILIYNNWADQAFVSRPSVLMNLTGSSSLVYDFYENGGGNQVVFQNITPVLANTLTTNTSQSISVGSSGTAISGDVLGTLPTGISLSGTGYQWTYSTTPGGARTNISGATSATYIPNASIAPFNTPGTYYIYRNVVLSSANNVAPNPYVATNESNASTLVVNLPLITTSTASLSGFTYNLGGGPSTQQSFTVSGVYLTSNLVVTPPTNYEISLTSGGAFVATNPISLTPTSGTVSTTTIYVRLKAALAAGNYNAQNIVSTSNSAVTKNVSCSGTVYTPLITASLTTLTGFKYIIGYGPSPQQSFTVSGTNLITDLTVTPSTNYEISITSNAGFQSTPIILTQSGGSVSTTTIYVRLKSGLAAANYNNENIVTTSTNAASKTVTCSGTVTTPTITTSVTTLSGFSYPFGYGPSAEQSFTVSGTDLVSNVSVYPSSSFEISIGSGTSFVATNPISLAVSGGIVNATTIYVRMKAGIALGAVAAENIAATATSATTKNVACSGNVVTAPLITASAISGSFSYTFGSGPSAQQTFTVSGTNLIANVTITPPVDYEISTTSGTGFVSTPISLTQSGGTLSSTTIYVRLKIALGTANYSENVVASSTSAVSSNVAVSGTVNASATIYNAISFLSGFIYTLNNGPSGIQSFVVKAIALTQDVTVTPPTNFEISKNGTTFQSTALTLLRNGTVLTTDTIVYVRMKGGLAVGTYGPLSSSVVLTSGGAITKSVACTGQVVNARTLLVSKPTLTGFGYEFSHGPSSPQSFTVSGASLTANLVMTAPANYQISLSPSTGYTSTITLTGATVNPTLIYVRLQSGLTAGDYGTLATPLYLTVVSTGATSINISCIGKVFASPLISASGGGIYCEGSTINLTSTGADIQSFYWTGPNAYYTTSQNPVLTTNATASLSGTYTVNGSVVVGGNLITNGDFSAGNTSFSSGYGYVAPTAGALNPEGLYTIVNLPSAVHNDFTNYPDHTTGTGLQMVVNGAPTAGVVVWSQCVPVIPGATYQFTYSEQTVNITQVPKNASQLQLYVNGIAAGPVYTAPQVNYQWATFLYNASAGSNTVLNLELINQNTIAAGNDFALDDIVFQQILPATSPTNVTVNPIVPVSVSVSASPGTSVYSGSPVTFTATPTNGGSTPAYQWQVNGINVGTNSTTYTYVPINGDVVKCILTSSLTCVTNNPANASVIMTVTHRVNYWYGYIDTDWAKTGNWTANYVPLTGDDVEFATTSNFTSTAINDLWLDQNRTIGSLINATTKRLVIPPAKGLNVNNAVSTDGSPDRVYIQSSTTNPNGSLVFTQPNLNQTVKATVEMQAFGQYNATGYTYTIPGTSSPVTYHYTWQYFGIPMSSVLVDTVFAGSYVRQYNESKTVQYGKWTQLAMGAVLSPFKAYELTQNSPKIIIFKGQLVNNSSTIPITYTIGAADPGQNILANPYTGAISIPQLQPDVNTEQTVYLYNTGAFGQWGNNGGSTVVLGGSITTPGVYQSVPFNTAGYPGIPIDIPSMQGFLIKTKSTTAGSLTIPYSSVIINNVSRQRAPKKKTVSDKSYLKVTLQGNNSFDNLWLIKVEGTTKDFDNGWDGYKILPTVNMTQIFAMENCGNLQVNASTDINNTTIGLVSGGDLQDTLIFTNENLKASYQGVYLVDLVENKTIDITEDSTTYVFNPGNSNEPSKRFKIVTRNYERNSTDENSNIKLFSSNSSIFVQNLSNLRGDVLLYDIVGHYLKNVPFGANGIIAIPGLLPGVYIAKASNGIEQVSKRLIVN